MDALWHLPYTVSMVRGMVEETHRGQTGKTTTNEYECVA